MGSDQGSDKRWMRHALRLGRRAMGTTGANPAVGCAIVRDGRLIGAGWTGHGGRPHAETQALAMAGPAARGATAYVTLEPCSHHGRTGPCTEALVAAGVARVVTAIADPDPRVSGQGHEALRAAGVALATGLLADEARRDLAGYLSRIVEQRPHVVLKLAVSDDGKIAATAGAPSVITGAAARARAHLLRAECDAVLVGIGTALADDPLLTCRLPGLECRSPVRVVVDSRLSLPLDGRLAATADDVPVWLLTASPEDAAKAAPLVERGIEVIGCAAAPDGVDLAEAMRRLAGRGINRVLVEGGARLAQGLVAGDLVDEIQLFTAPKRLGPGGLDALGGLSLRDITHSSRFRATAEERLGDDCLNHYVRAA